MLEDIGELPLSAANEANIPMNCFLSEPDKFEAYWIWQANNYMPRKEVSTEGAYKLKADNKDEILGLVRKYVLPLYQIAAENIGSKGHNYYWKR